MEGEVPVVLGRREFKRAAVERVLLRLVLFMLPRFFRTGTKLREGDGVVDGRCVEVGMMCDVYVVMCL